MNVVSEKPAHKRLIKLCETRFVERHNSILSALQLVTYVHAALHKLPMADSRDTRLPSVNLLHSIGEERLESLILLQAHIDKTPSTDEVLDCFASSSARRFNLIM